MQRNKQRVWGIVLSYTAQIIQILTGLLYTPVMLKLLGKSEYGLYQLVSSVVSYLSLIGLGFSSSYQRYYARTKAEGKENGLAKMNGMFLLIFLAMSFICCICGVVMIANVEHIFGNGLTSQEMEKARILLGFMVVNMALTFPNSLFTSNTTAHEHFFFQRMINIFQNLLNPFLCLPILILGYGSIGMVFVSTFLTVTAFAVNGYYSICRLKMRFSFGEFDFGKLREMWGFTFFIFLNQIVNQVNWSVDRYLLGRMCGTAVVAVYSVGGQLQTMYSQLSSAISTVFIPQVNKIVANEDDNSKLTDLLIKVGRIQCYIILMICSGFALYGKSFIRLWAGEGYEESYYIALMFMVALIVPYIQNLGIEIQRAKNKHKIRSFVYTAIAICNIVISIPLIKRWGGIGAALGTVMALVIGNIIFMNFYYKFYIGLDIQRFWKSLLRNFGVLIPAAIVGLIMSGILQPETWLQLFASLALYGSVYSIFAWIFALSKEERQLFCGFAKQRLLRKWTGSK